MIGDFWGRLKSGSDIRGVASEGINGEEINLTDEVVKKISMAFAIFMYEKLGASKTDLKISVGHDSRISATRIKECVVAGLTEMGVNVIDTGLSSTPAMFMSTMDLNCDAAIEITASHHPFNRNGLKFFTKTSGLEGEDIEKILSIAKDGNFLPLKVRGTCVKMNYMEQYCAHLREMIKQDVNSENFDCPLKGIKIVVDAGNGAGGFYASEVLAPLGADISGSQFLNPDGTFPNHIPNPENSEAIDSVKKKVIVEDADLGIIFDTDVDRCGAVDKKGREINRNRLIALAAVIALEKNPGGTVVTDSITSDGLKLFIEKKIRGVHHRFKRGYRNVINESQRLNALGVNSPLAIETSGHAAFRENYFLDDGAYLITKIVIKLAQLKAIGQNDIGSLIAELKEPKESIEKRIPILVDDFKAYGKKVISKLKNYAKDQESWQVDEKNLEGIKVYFKDKEKKGWLLLRMSVHDPLMPLNVESDVTGGTEKILSEVKTFLKTCEGLSI